jgi:glutamate carboxypeptidase
MPVTILGALMDPRTDPAGLLPLAHARSERTLASLELLVNRDSGSYSFEGVNRVADLCEERMRGGGWTVERLAHQPAAGEARLGDLVIGRRQGARPVEAGGRRVLLMAHMDTVFDDGAAAARPFRVEGGRAYGPGVADDKCGLVAGIEAVEVLCDDAAFDDFAAITLVCTPDEEIGSPFSKDVLTRLAGEHEVGVGLEAARVNGALVTSRKGISALEIGIQGKAVHAGVRPKEGINAALEAARKTEALQALNGRWAGVTCNVGVIHAGTRPNVVAERAELQLDLRAVTSVDFERALAAVREIAATSYVPGTTARLEVVHRHPPMERTEAVAGLLAEARQVAAALGFELREAASGGAGDANTTAAAGLPTIDGLAPVGGEAHGPGEWLDLESVAPRTTLLAGFLARVGAAQPPS